MAGSMVEQELVFIRGGLRVRGSIVIGAPRVVDELEARCDVEVRAPGLMEERASIAGSDPLQALILATRFLGLRLQDFVAKGGKLTDLDGDELPLRAYFDYAPRPVITIKVPRRRA